MTKKLNFVESKNAWKFQLQDKAQRVEELGEEFNKLRVTPLSPNGQILRFRLQDFIYPIQRQVMSGLFDELFSPTHNPMAFPYSQTDDRVLVGQWGYVDERLIDVGDGRKAKTKIEDLEIAPGEFVTMNIANPFTRNDANVKVYETTADFVKLIKVTRTMFQGWNDNSRDKVSNLNNASLKLFYRQALAEGAVIEMYPTVRPSTREDGSKQLKNNLQLSTQKLWEILSEVDKGELDLQTAAKQFYTAKALRNQIYRKVQAGIETGQIAEDIVEMVNDATKSYAMGEEIEEFALEIKLEGEITDVTRVPAGLYKGLINGRTEYFDTSMRVGRMDLTSAAREHNSNLDITRLPDNFTF